jgi:hypothetical protein
VHAQTDIVGTVAHRHQSRWAAAWGIAAGLVLMAVLVEYHTILTGQGGPGGQPSTRVAFISAYIVGVAAVAFAAAGCLMADRSAPARPLFMASASGAVVLGIAGIFSIGIGLFVAVAMQLVAAGRAPAHAYDRRVQMATALLVALPPIALVAGLALTS